MRFNSLAARSEESEAMAVLVPTSWGEVIDKITILEIKSERLTDARSEEHTSELQSH